MPDVALSRQSAREVGMAWTLIESATENDTVLELYGKDGMFMIRANGLELMNGFCHDSETALGIAAAGLVRSREPRILLGGLGLGYTAAALAGAVGDVGTITVAEFSGAVIDWFHRYVQPLVLPDIHRNLTVVHADIADLLMAEACYDVVVLDVDNGPEPLVTPKNGTLYSTEGLKALHACLSADGVALLWSGFESHAFEVAAERAGFTVTCKPFRRARADLSHYTYVLGKTSAASPQPAL
jgi:spermidine synthase